MLDLTPNPVALQIGPFPIYWYGIGYAVGLALAYLLMVRLAKRAGEDPDVVGNGIIIVAVAALIGGRLYHVIDQWALYKDDPLKIVLPPYTGLGVYGGIITGTVAAFLYARYSASVPALGGHRRAGPVRDAGSRALGQLLQPGAVRPADLAPVGHPDRLRPSRRRVSLQRVPRSHDRVPPAVPVRIDLGRPRRAGADLDGLSPAPRGSGPATSC